ncbi:MAG TPA: TonB-dependent receptor [Sphingomicrobium sp.]|nr:TonB-dependent receptor [Sphingomicrobium sp.]
MILTVLLAAQAGSPPAVAPSQAESPEIIVTATSLAPVPEKEAPATVTILDEKRIEGLGQPLALDLLRLAPGVAVASAGPPGSQTQVRIRGAEANHTLLLIDGIRFNDPASGNEPRFELLSSEGVRRIEIVRGPQSALFGAEAIGGVVALSTLAAAERTGGSASFEAGSHDFRRGGLRATLGGEGGALALYGGLQRSDGIDSVGAGGERDGYENATIGGSGRLKASDAVGFSLAGRFVTGTSDFDGLDPGTFRRADTLDASHNHIGALRLATDIRPLGSKLGLTLGATMLRSANRNRRGEERVNRTAGERLVLDGLGSFELSTGAVEHRLSIAGDHEKEEFKARDTGFGGGTNQDRRRDRSALVGEWQASLGERLTTNLALRRDWFEGFEDATTVRASAVARLFGSLSALLSYGQGIARPSFFELFGFFPNSFVGNPELQAERSRGVEAGLRYRTSRLDLNLVGYRQRLKDEIVGTFDPISFLASTANASGASRRRGLEIEGAWRPLEALEMTASYSFLDAEEQQVRGGTLVREVRRPRHSGSLGADARWGALSAGLSLAYVGKRQDVDFDVFPSRRVTLDDYALLDARIAYRVSAQMEGFVRIANAFDARYQDVVGYATPGRTAYAGVRIRVGE